MRELEAAGITDPELQASYLRCRNLLAEQWFGLTPDELRARRVTPAVRDLFRFEMRRARELYRQAYGVVPLLHPTNRQCIHVALTLYSKILDAIEAVDHEVFTNRARVGRWRKLQVAVPAGLRLLRG